MDLFNETRSLAYSGPVLRRGRSDTGFTIAWSELVAALLDNYCKTPRLLVLPFLIYYFLFLVVILMREEKRPNGVVRRIVVSRVRIDFLILLLNLMPAYSPYHYPTSVWELLILPQILGERRSKTGACLRVYDTKRSRSILSLYITPRTDLRDIPCMSQLMESVGIGIQNSWMQLGCIKLGKMPIWCVVDT